MKKLFYLPLLTVFAFSVNAQQIIPNKASAVLTPVPLFSNNLSTAIIDVNQAIADINKELYYYSQNYYKLLETSKLFTADSKDKFSDFYEAYNYNFSNSLINSTPMIKGMPPPGPNLDYYNVNSCGPGLYDKPIK